MDCKKCSCSRNHALLLQMFSLLLNVAISFLDINTFEAGIRRKMPMHMKTKIHEQGRQ